MGKNDGYTDIGERIRVGWLLVQGGVSYPKGAEPVTAFLYVATGAEGASFPVVLPSPRQSASYVAQAGGAGLANFLLFDCPRSTYAADRFTLVCSAAPAAGDVIAITVEDVS